MRPYPHIICLIGLVSCVSCTNEPPEDEDYCLDPSYKVPLSVTVDLDDTFSPYVTVDSLFRVTEKTRSDNEPVDSMQLRYYVAAFPKSAGWPTVVSASADKVVPVNIHPGKYRIVGWVDYESPVGNRADATRSYNFYTDDFYELLLKNKYSYTAASPYKLGFRGAEDKTIAYNASDLSVTARPAMGGYRIVATDSAAFLPAKVTVHYSTLLPSAINACTGEINWWWDDISYTTCVRDSVLASDFVLSQDDRETSVVVVVEIYDADGKLRARKKDVTIPLRNGGITTLRGNFYSVLEQDDIVNGGGGITIKTEWDDTFEIEI